MEKIKYIAIYKNNDVAHDNNFYCETLNELFIFIERFISLGWYDNLEDFIKDYEICKISHCNKLKIKDKFNEYLNRNNI